MQAHGAIDAPAVARSRVPVFWVSWDSTSGATAYNGKRYHVFTTLSSALKMRPMDTNKLLLRPTEAADAMGVSRSKAYVLISSGAIPSIRIGGSVRVPIDALKAWIAAQTQEQAEAAGR